MSLYYNKIPDQIKGARVPPPSARTAVRRRAGRGRYDRAAIDAVLDAGFFGHLALVSEGQPYAIPMLYARDGDVIYLHGSPLSRLLGELVEGVPVCLTVTLIDGLVLARSAFHHSVNYRSVVVLGEARPLRAEAAKRAALDALVEQIVPGRTSEARGPSEQELEATEVAVLPITEASVKVRTGPPVDAPEDYALEVWAGELPLTLTPGAPLTDKRCSTEPPAYVRNYGLNS
jgi:nitroimidazol reductase NimA-like FMN-containing flavoprotein (pyridoxamine 5'-phosphate oxidase superfamily)